MLRGIFPIIFTTLVLLSVMTCLMASVGAQTLPTNTVEITEVQYAPSAVSKEWLEIRNNTAAAIDIATLKLKVNNGSVLALTADSGNSGASLASGAVAIIAKDGVAFKKAHSGYTGLLYTASFSLPVPGDGVTSTITLYEANGTTLVSTFSFVHDVRAGGAGISLHVGADSVTVVAPETPGAIAVNPMEAYAPVSSFLVSSVVSGGTATDRYHFVQTGNTISLTLLHAEHIPSTTVVQLVVNDTNGTEVFRTLTVDSTKQNTRTMQTYTYTVQSGDSTGGIAYKVLDAGNTELASGNVAYLGGAVVIDKTAPVAGSFTVTPSGAATLKTAVLQITDTYPSMTVKYKLGLSQQCSAKKAYTDATGSVLEAKVLFDQSAYVARIPIAGEEHNDTYVCAELTDLAGNVAYASSDKITQLSTIGLMVSELTYSPTRGASFEWIEVTNYGTATEDLAALVILDESSGNLVERSVTHYSGSTSLAKDAVAIFARDPINFLAEFPSYSGPLFTVSLLSLGDDDDTVALKKGDDEVHRISYERSDGAYKNNKTLHIKQTGVIFEDFPTPGILTGEPPEAVVLVVPDQPLATQEAGRPSVLAVEFDKDKNTVPGRNLFFTKKDKVTFVLSFNDDITEYNSDNASTFITREASGTTANFAVREATTQERFGGEYHVTYEVAFESSGNSVADNRVVFSLIVTDSDGKTRRSSFTVVRTTVVPTLSGGTNASVLGFAVKNPGREESAIIPVSVEKIPFGDWLRVEYVGSCGAGVLQFMARNGAHGIPYRLSPGRYEGCSVRVTDTAGNAHRGLILPTLIVTRDA